MKAAKVAATLVAPAALVIVVEVAVEAAANLALQQVAILPGVAAIVAAMVADSANFAATLVAPAVVGDLDSAS